MWCNSPNNRDIYELIIKKKEKRFTLSHKKNKQLWLRWILSIIMYGLIFSSRKKNIWFYTPWLHHLTFLTNI